MVLKFPVCFSIYKDEWENNNETLTGQNEQKSSQEVKELIEQTQADNKIDNDFEVLTK